VKALPSHIDCVKLSFHSCIGISLLLQPAESPETNNLTDAELIDLYVNRKPGLDALSVLENELATRGNDSILIRNYWDVVNKLMIRR